MFKLITVEDVIQVPARNFGKKRMEALEFEVNKRYSNRVIPKHGLCVGLWDWLDVEDDRLIPQTGESSTRCVFRLVAFAPFEGELIFTTIRASNESGLLHEVGFFDVIRVPKSNLPCNSSWDSKEYVWIWKPNTDQEDQVQTNEVEESGSVQKLYMDVTNESVVRVVQIVYDDRSSTPPSIKALEGYKPPMSIVATLHDHVLEDNQGLGDPLWWYEDEEDAGEAAREDDEVDREG